MASVSPSRSDPTRTTRAAGPEGTAPCRHRALGQQFVSPGASRRRGVAEPRRVSVEHLASRGDSRGSRSPRRPRELAPPSADLRRLVACAMAPRRGRTQGGAWTRLGDLHSGRGFRGALGSCVVCLGFPEGDSRGAGVRRWPCGRGCGWTAQGRGRAAASLGASEPQALKQCHCVVSCWGAWPWDSSAVDIASTIHRASRDQ